MRIQTRLFLGTALLVLALTAVQWWLHQRQLEAMESELAAVATAVSKDLLVGAPDVLVRGIVEREEDMIWLDDETCRTPGDADGPWNSVHVVAIPEGGEGEAGRHVAKRVVRRLPAEAGEAAVDDGEVRLEAEVVADRLEVFRGQDVEETGADWESPGERRFILKVVATDEGANRTLVISGDHGQLQRIPIPVEPAVRSFRSTMRHGALVSGLLLVVGLAAAGVLANRVTRPLRALAEGAEAVGRGDLGVQIPVTASGEVGELQHAFNSMSARLAELEDERDAWRRREHLAQLGDLSRGLAHTLRNPLNTLGLAVEELAAGDRARGDLVDTSRSQIRRIDQWLRSFLALGAEDAADPTREDLDDLTRAVVFEAVQQGAPVRLTGAGGEVPVKVVATAVRAALANLLENAAEVTPAGTAIEVEVGRDGALAVVTVRDHGPGLPDDVRRRLFEPHVTTKVGGSGMGLFLARQLLVGMHGGMLEIEDHPEGGTIAAVKLPVDEGDGA